MLFCEIYNENRNANDMVSASIEIQVSSDRRKGTADMKGMHGNGHENNEVKKNKSRFSCLRIAFMGHMARNILYLLTYEIIFNEVFNLCEFFNMK